MPKVSQKETKRVEKELRVKTDANWFSNTPVSTLRNLGNEKAIETPCAVEATMTEPLQEDEVREYRVDDESIEATSTTTQNSQSFMTFMNERLSERLDCKTFCGLFTDSQPADVLAVSGNDMVWTCVAVAVDTGSCANVTPPGVFAIGIEPSEASKKKKPFFGADKSPIMNLGNQTIEAVCEEGYKWGTTFAVADKLSRPLASGYEITEAGNEQSMWKGGGHIKCSKSGATTALRQEGKLWFLDLWVKVPRSISNAGFTRPS